MEDGMASVHRSRWSLRRTLRLMLGDDRGRPAWRDARMLVVTAPVDPRAIGEWLPPAVRFATPPRATLFLADYPETSFGIAYRECGLLLHVRYLGREFLHCPWMVVDDDTALIQGRDLLGFPKKMARISLSFDGGRFSGSVERRGIELVRLEGALGEAIADTVPFPRPFLNVRGVLGPGPGLLLRIRIDQRVHRAMRFAGSLRIGASEVDPLDRLALPDRVEGVDATLDMGSPSAARAWSVIPVGLVPPTWMVRAFPFRAW